MGLRRTLDPEADRGGKRGGDYELLEEVARGGMGVVYRARQRSLGRIVALKVLLGGTFAGDAGRRRFLAEAAAAARLVHPHIVAVHEAGELDGQPFYSMDYVQGRTLAELLREGPLPVSRAAGYVATIARAIHYSHGEGVLHRDLKPSNVLVDDQDQPRVTDFGLAKAWGTRGEGDALTLTGQALGSPAYMPPEQALGPAAQLGPTCDVYALGAVLYECVTGVPPFRGETPHAVLEQVQSREPVPPGRLNGSVSRDLETVCLKCLEKDPARRYATAGELGEDLGRFLRGEPVHARPLGVGGRAWRWARRHPVVAGLASSTLFLGMVVILIAGLGAHRIRQSRDEARARLAESLVSEARARRIAAEPGARAESLDRLSQALALEPTIGLRQRIRREWVAVLAMPDVRRVVPATLPGCEDPMLMCFDPRFERCALGHQPGGGIHVYRVEDGSLLQHFTVRPLPDELAGFSPDGEFLLARYRHSMAVWRVQSGEVVLPPEPGKGDGWNSGGFSSDGAWFARGEADGGVALYRPVTQGAGAWVRDHAWKLPFPGRVSAMCWGPGADLLALVLEGERVLVCTARSGEVRWDRVLGPGLLGLSWSQTRGALAVQTPQDSVVLLHAENGSDLRQVPTPGDASATVAFSPSGEVLAAATERFGVRLFNAWNGRKLGSDRWGTWHLHFDVAGKRLGTLFAAGRAGWLEWTPSPVLRSLQAGFSSAGYPQVGFSSDGRRLLSLAGHGAVLWDWERSAVAGWIPLRQASGIAFGETSDRVLMAVRDRLWEYDFAGGTEESGVPRESPRELAVGRRFWAVAVSRSLGWVAVADHGAGTLRVLDRDRRLVRELSGLTFPGYPAFSPDGTWLVCGAGNRLLVWPTANLASPPLERATVGELVRFSPDGHWLVVCGRELALWRTGAWDRPVLRNAPAVGEAGSVGAAEGLLPLQPDNGTLFAAVVSPDGRWLAATQQDRLVHLIDLPTRQTLVVLEPPGESRILDLAFSPDGQRLAAACDRGEVQLWDLAALRRELAGHGLNW